MRRFLIRAIVSLVLIASANTAFSQYNKDYFFYMGRHFMMNNDYHEAIRTLNVLLRFDDDAYEGYFLRGIAKYNLDDLLGADADFTEAIKHNPVFTNAYTYRAITRSRLGNYDDALKDFHEAIELRPDVPGAYYSRGVTRLLNQQFEEAIGDFDMFIRQEKKVADAYINRGICYLQLKDTTAAYDNFSTAIRTNRENPDGYNRRGMLFMEQKRYDEALEDLDTAISHDSTYVASFFNRAIIFANTNRPMQALGDFDKVLALDSTSSLTYFNRAIVRSQIGDYNRALEDYNEVVKYSPDNVLVYYNRAGIHSQIGNIEAAIEDYTRAISLYPDFANAYLNRSYMRMTLGDMKRAKQDRQMGERKIAEHRSRLKIDSSYSVYADTTQKFDKLLSFDAKLTKSFEHSRQHNAPSDVAMRLIPLFKFTITRADSTMMARSDLYHSQREADFKVRVSSDDLWMSRDESNIATDSLILREQEINRRIGAEGGNWILYFERGVLQSQIKQYTAAVNTFTVAIAENPSNPFLYINRSTTRAEMIDFISSIDNSYQRITIDSDPAKRLHNSGTRQYNYDDAMEDINKAIKLYPDYAYSYYNRANLHAISNRLPEAYEDYSRAIELNPQFGEAYFNRGLVQIFMKDTRKGCLDLSKAGELGIENAYEALKFYGGDISIH